MCFDIVLFGTLKAFVCIITYYIDMFSSYTFFLKNKPRLLRMNCLKFLKRVVFGNCRYISEQDFYISLNNDLFLRDKDLQFFKIPKQLIFCACLKKSILSFHKFVFSFKIYLIFFLTDGSGCFDLAKKRIYKNDE